MEDMNARKRFIRKPRFSLSYAESKHLENVPVLVYYLNPPRPLIGFAKLNDAVGGPLRRIEAQPGLRTKLVTVKPPVINYSVLRHRIEGGVTANLA
jgi:hypothetical protein